MKKLYRVTEIGVDGSSDLVLGYTFGTYVEVVGVVARIIECLGSDTVLDVAEVFPEVAKAA